MVTNTTTTGTISRNVTLKKVTHAAIEKLRSTPKENRSFSSMTDILVNEALAARKIKVI